MKLAIGVPTSGMCKSTFAYALSHTVGLLATKRAFDITVLMQESSVVHSNREQIVERALEWGATHLLFTDDDMYWMPTAVEIMISRDLPIVCCNYPKREFPIVFTAMGMEHAIPTLPTSKGIEEVLFCGLGLALIKAEVFEAMEAPYFLPGWMSDRNEYTTEDCAFMVRAREAGFPTVIDHDASKCDVAHLGVHAFQWNQAGAVSDADQRAA